MSILCQHCGTQVEVEVEECPICSFATGYQSDTQEDLKTVDEVFREQGDSTFITDFDGDDSDAVYSSEGD